MILSVYHCLPEYNGLLMLYKDPLFGIKHSAFGIIKISLGIKLKIGNFVLDTFADSNEF